MSIVLIFNNKDPKPWKEALLKALPTVAIEIYPEVKDPATVQFALCWKPTQNVLHNFPNLKVIQSVGASIEHITRTHDTIDPIIQVTRVVDDNLTTDMWEFLVAIVSAQLKNLPMYSVQQQKQHWQQHAYKQFKNTTVTLLGLGKIGGFVAEKFAALGCTVKGWSHTKKEIPNVQSYAGDKALHECLQHSDIVINLLPLTPTTENILNAKNLKHTNPGAFLINVGRGEHLVEDDLVTLLDTQQLSGALLDVFRTEPLPQEHPFWKHPNIQITPHIASLTNVASASQQIADNYKRFLANQELIHTVSLTKGY